MRQRKTPSKTTANNTSKSGVDMKFQIEIEETFQKVVTVEAATLAEAIEQAKTDYNNGEIVLDGMDFDHYKIQEFKE